MLSQNNHRMLRVGRDLWSSSSPAPHSRTFVLASATRSTRRKMLKHLFSLGGFKHQPNIKPEEESQLGEQGEQGLCCSSDCCQPVCRAPAYPPKPGEGPFLPDTAGSPGCLLGVAPPLHPRDFQETGHDVQVPRGGAVGMGGSVPFPAQGCGTCGQAALQPWPWMCYRLWRGGERRAGADAPPRFLGLQQGVIYTPPVISSQQGHCKQPMGLTGALCRAAAGVCYGLRAQEKALSWKR